MKRNQAFPSNYLGQDDVPAPIIATIDDVRNEQMSDRDTGGMKDKPVMRFTDRDLKPLIVNNVNWITCEHAYGEDSDDWKGQAIEIYTDPSIMFGRERVGGIRVRIPVAPKPAVAPKPIVAPSTNRTTPPPAPKPVVKAPLSADDKHKLILNGYAQAKAESRVMEWAAYADKESFAPHHQEEQDDAYNAALDRLRGVPLGVGDDIPF